MNLLLLLGVLASGNMLSAASSPRVDELLLAQAEAKAYRAAWLELQRRDEILGIAALSNDVRDSHDQIARLSGELIRAERYAKELAEQTKSVLDAAANWAGEPIPAKKAAARAEFESAKRALSELAKNNQPRPLARSLTDAQVVAVDRDQQALVLNLGRSQGAKEGMPFRILRGDKVLGTCRLLEVRELVSAGLPEQLNDGAKIQVGDRVSVLAQK
jgi:hypothetical protein